MASIPSIPLLDKPIIIPGVSQSAQTVKSKWKLLLGVVLSLLAGISLGISMLFVKLLVSKWQSYSFLPLTISRYVAWSLFAFSFLFYNDDNVNTSSCFLSSCIGHSLKSKTVTVFAATIFGLSEICFNWSINYIPIAITTVIFYLCPLVATCLLALLQRKCVPIFDMFLLLVAFAGVAIIADPFSGQNDDSTFDTQRLYGLLAALASMLTSAVAFVTQQLYMSRIHWSAYTLMIGVCGTFLSSLVFIGNHFYSANEVISFCGGDEYGRLSLLVCAATGCFAAAAAKIALSSGLSTTIVTMLMSVELLCGGLFDYVFWDIQPTALAFTGSALVLLVVAMVTFKYWFLEKYESTPVARHCDVDESIENIVITTSSFSDKLYNVLVYSFC